MCRQTLFPQLAQCFEGASFAENAIPTGLLRFVNLHEINMIPLQALEAGLEATQDGVTCIIEGFGEVADLGGEEVGLCHPLQSVAVDLLAATFAIQRGRVEVVDAQIEGTFYDTDAV